MAALDKAIATAHAQLLQAREELAQPPTRSFQDAFVEALRRPFEAAALAHSSSSRDTRWRRADLRDFLGLYFPQYAQQPAAFSALCASLAKKDAEQQGDDDDDVVSVTFDGLKRVLVRQYGSTRLVAKDPFPLEPCVEPKPERRPSIATYVPGTGSDNSSDDAAAPATAPVLRDFKADVMKKSKSWLGRWRARHLLLRWGVLKMHKRSLTSRSFRHGHSSSSSGSSASVAGGSSRAADSSSSVSSPAVTAAGAAPNTKTYDLQDLVSLQLEHVSDGESASARKAALTLKFQTTLTPSSNSHSNAGGTASQDIKTLILGGGEASDTLVSIRDHVATFALYLELSRRDRLPSMTKIRRYIAAGAKVNVRVRIPRISIPKDGKDTSRRRSQVKQPPRGMVTALQLAFLQDPRVPSFESMIAVLLNAGADPRSLLYWDFATQVAFIPASSEKKEKSGEHHQRRRLRKRLLLLDKVESDGDESATFQCCEVQADDGARWNLLMYFCWLGDLEGVKQLLAVTGVGGASGSQGRSSSRQMVTYLDHVNAAGDTALHISIKAGKEAVAVMLVEAALSTNAQAMHQCDARGEPVVHIALVAQQWSVVDALVAGGAVDPRSYDAFGNTALHLAIQVRAPVALIARLIQVYRHSAPSGGLDGRAGRRGGNDTPLSLALKSGQQEVVALLLASGASPSGSGCKWSHAFVEKRESGNEELAEGKEAIGNDDSALHVAIKAGMELAAAALIAHKADIYAVDARGASPLALAVRYGLYALAAALVDQHQKKQNQAASALHLASAWPHSPAMRLVVELLLQERVDAGNWNNVGLAPLHIALREECGDTFIELFLRYGQDLNLWTEGNAYEDDGGEGESSEFLSQSGARPSAITLVASCPQNPLMMALESENAAAFRALVRGGARTRALMPRARVGLLQLAVHFNVRDPELLACLLDDPELEHSAHSDVADQWGVSPRDARSRLMEVWRKERSGVDVASPSSVGNDTELSLAGESQQQQRPPPLHPTSDEQLSPYKVLAAEYPLVDASTLSNEPRVPPPLRITVPRPPPEQLPLETAQYLRALPRPPTLSPTTLEYLREEERATLTLVAQEARGDAQDWLAKRIGQKKLLSDAHAQLQNAKKHRRTASGSSVSSSRDDLEASTTEGGGARSEAAQSDQQLLEELKVSAAKKFIEKHVAEAVAEARLAIEREKQTIFQETGLYPGMTSTSRKNKKKGDGKHRSLLVRAASSTTGSMLLPASSASVASVSSDESNPTQLSEDGYGSASFWWSERGTTFLSDDSWLSSSNPRGGTMLSDPASASVSSWASNGRGTMLDGSYDRRLSFASRSFLDSDESDRHGKASRAERLDQSTDSFIDPEHLPSDFNPLDHPSFPQVISERNTMA
ncbi:hypothetical protein PF005_g14468 [Phytophthora fragariae]|uniref:Uncharacterized protein n=1 Tax=Phytophthora fragariae TaxID=53985 RepID=A0A6A3RKZ9_9STRA|nr:hypothetical protein PF003_g28651 [Phytophthora fragariae]KAE8934135.1 hypothetical protein PF009_g15883 [Phytophthora fragariae]KAE9098500.1 hypothetical protein PF007_g16239 [Phytophthora fragariae]KAE9202694.1 hypothetical protein PF005_g14468 [Phytophthora fragariae]KAE9299926.1 hypothetical protein PF001_g15203 [Phytophthora fragariae]